MCEGYDVDLLRIDSCRTHIQDSSADLSPDLRTKARLTKGMIHTAASIKQHQVLTCVYDQQVPI